jgi:hypothetical protein
MATKSTAKPAPPQKPAAKPAAQRALPPIEAAAVRPLGEAGDDELDPLGASAGGAARPPNRYEARPPNRYEARPPNRYEHRTAVVG